MKTVFVFAKPQALEGIESSPDTQFTPDQAPEKSKGDTIEYRFFPVENAALRVAFVDVIASGLPLYDEGGDLVVGNASTALRIARRVDDSWNATIEPAGLSCADEEPPVSHCELSADADGIEKWAAFWVKVKASLCPDQALGSQSESNEPPPSAQRHVIHASDIAELVAQLNNLDWEAFDV